MEVNMEVNTLTDEQRAVLRFDEHGLIPAVVQQHDTGEVLMVAWMDAAALAATLELGESVFHSRSRGEQWHKGATSGNRQRLVDLRIDCDGDVLLVLVDQGGDGVACHTGARSCFHRQLPGGPTSIAAAAPELVSGDASSVSGDASSVSGDASSVSGDASSVSSHQEPEP